MQKEAITLPLYLDLSRSEPRLGFATAQVRRFDLRFY